MGRAKIFVLPFLVIRPLINRGNSICRRADEGMHLLSKFQIS